MTLSTLKPGTTEKSPGAEPLPGYRLVAPLGKGGFGEVWKCEAPGGLLKAIKFVSADGDRFRQEVAAFEQIRSIRHPFLLGLDRAELCGGELVMVMELADCQLQDRYRVCQREGLLGIPREELIGYLREAAESLDMIGNRYGLQHLDVKPENLFLVAGHAKVGDYGLVRRADRARGKDDDAHGFTPRYTPPEVLLGRVDTRSDQYSLAIVYVELLTGYFPYPGKTPQQLVFQHLNSAPDLSKLSAPDRSVVARALAKEPADRFPSCSTFIQALSEVAGSPPAMDPIQNGQGSSVESLHLANDQTIVLSAKGGNYLPPKSDFSATTPLPGSHSEASEVGRGPTIQRSNRPTLGRINLRRAESAPTDPFAGLVAVMPVSELIGTTPRGSIAPGLTSEEFVDAVLDVAAANLNDMYLHKSQSEGVLKVCFLSTLPFAMVPLKLMVVAERFRLEVQQVNGSEIHLWRGARIEPRKGGKSDLLLLSSHEPAGLEIIVQSPDPHSAEYTVRGRLRGMPDDEFARKAHDELPVIVEHIRIQLQNIAERRVHPRIPTEFPIRIYPLYPDGEIGQPIGGRCLDVSQSGARLSTAAPIRTERLYVEFHEIEAVARHAVYTRVVRTAQDLATQWTITGVRFRQRG